MPLIVLQNILILDYKLYVTEDRFECGCGYRCVCMCVHMRSIVCVYAHVHSGEYIRVFT